MTTVLELAGREVRITSPDKVLFAQGGQTKLDLVRYYAAAARSWTTPMAAREPEAIAFATDGMPAATSPAA